MALPTTYLTSTKNLAAILDAIRNAQAPPRFTQKFLEDLGFTSSSDRLIIGVLKSLDFLADTGEPKPKYHQYLDRSESRRVLAQAIRSPYSDVFQLRRDAEKLTAADLKGKMKTLSQGEYSDAVLGKMATTFKKLVELADFSVEPEPGVVEDQDTDDDSRDSNNETDSSEKHAGKDRPSRLPWGGLTYNINIHLPESRDQAVYDALFRSLKEHLA